MAKYKIELEFESSDFDDMAAVNLARILRDEAFVRNWLSITSRTYKMPNPGWQRIDGK